jgi:hypothetical protein
MKELITVDAAIFGAMYDALNIAYERLHNKNSDKSESPYIRVINDAIERAEEEL